MPLPYACTMKQNSAEFHPGDDDVFARIATRYDFLCDIFSLGIHRLWKRAMAKNIAQSITDDAPTTVLDIASGTGDIALRLATRMPSDSKIIVSDICQPMLDIALAKTCGLKTPHAELDFQILDAHNLSELADNSVDAYAISFAMKICERNLILSEAVRVLKPGGQFYCLEASHIPLNWLHKSYLKYMQWCVPIIARLATGGDRSAHDYLLRGINDMPNQAAFCTELESYGLTQVKYKNYSLGIVALHEAVKPV